MWELDHKEGWAPNNWCFWIGHWRILLRNPWTARRWNYSILKEINSVYSLEGLILKLKLWYLDYLMWRTNSLEKTLMLEKIESRREVGNREWNCWVTSLTQWASVWANSGRQRRTGKPGALYGVAKSQTHLDTEQQL